MTAKNDAFILNNVWIRVTGAVLMPTAFPSATVMSLVYQRAVQ